MSDLPQNHGEATTRLDHEAITQEACEHAIEAWRERVEIRDQHIDALRAEVARLRTQWEAMKPTYDAVYDDRERLRADVERLRAAAQAVIPLIQDNCWEHRRRIDNLKAAMSPDGAS